MNPQTKQKISGVAATIGTLVAGILGAAASGGAAAAAQAIQANGPTQDWKTIGSVAATGAVMSAAAYLWKSPIQPTQQ